MVAFPLPDEDAPTALRAQPANDGARPDLAPEVLDACADDCSDGIVALSVRIVNRGSVAAAPGARFVLYTLRDGALSEAGSVTVPDEIPAGWASAAMRLEVPASEWGERRVIEADGDRAEECDRLDDRVEDGIPDPCSD